MKSRILFTLVFVLSLSVLFVSKVDALTLQPTSGTYAPGSEVTVSVKTNSGLAANTTALQLRFNVENATVTQGFQSAECDTLNGGDFFCIGVCDAQNPIGFTANSLCLDIASAGENSSIPSDTTIGYFKVRLSNTPGQVATISATSENGYYVGTSLSPVSGVLGNYSVQSGVTPSPTPLPVTGIEDYPALVIIGGVFLVFVGVTFFVIRSRSQNLQS